jgi:SAM-dependent methyltransferase
LSDSTRYFGAWPRPARRRRHGQNAVEIETWNAAPQPVVVDWRATVPGKKPIVCDRASGQGSGAFDFDAHFDYLVEIGLHRSDRVLDFGCGAGRVGIWIIGYLAADRYFGVDSHLPSLDAFARYEIPLHGLIHKRPRLAYDDAFGFALFGVFFDWVLYLYVSAHLNDPLASTLCERVGEVLARRGRVVVVPHAPVVDSDFLSRIGLKLERVDERTGVPTRSIVRPICDDGHLARAHEELTWLLTSARFFAWRTLQSRIPRTLCKSSVANGTVFSSPCVNRSSSSPRSNVAEAHCSPSCSTVTASCMCIPQSFTSASRSDPGR